MTQKIQLRGDTKANWTLANPVLAYRETVLELDTNCIKVGDGVNAYNALTYYGNWATKDELNEESIRSIKSAASYGFSTAKTGVENSIALNNALSSGGYVIVTKPGVYEIANPILLPSNTKLEFAPGCTLKQVVSATSFSNMFMNAGILTGAANENIQIIGNGLTLDFNNINGNGFPLPAPYMNGRISIHKVTNFLLQGIHVNDRNHYGMYFFEITSCFNVKAYDINLENYGKDGIDIVHSSKVHIKNYKSRTQDDAIFVGAGWYQFDQAVGDCDDILIENWENVDFSPSLGCPFRIITSSWDDWRAGRIYAGGAEDAAESCVSAGKVYKKSTSGNQASTIAPTHSTGTIIYGDGCGWTVVSNSVSYASNASNIRLKNCKNIDYSGGYMWIYALQTAEQNTNVSKVDGLFIDGMQYRQKMGSRAYSFDTLMAINSVDIPIISLKNVNCKFDSIAQVDSYYNLINIEANSSNAGAIGMIEIDNLNFVSTAVKANIVSTKTAYVSLECVSIKNSIVKQTLSSTLFRIANRNCFLKIITDNLKVSNSKGFFEFAGSLWTPASARYVSTKNSHFDTMVYVYEIPGGFPVGTGFSVDVETSVFKNISNLIFVNGVEPDKYVINFRSSQIEDAKLFEYHQFYNKRYIDTNTIMYINNAEFPVIKSQGNDSGGTGYRMLVRDNT